MWRCAILSHLFRTFAVLRLILRTAAVPVGVSRRVPPTVVVFLHKPLDPMSEVGSFSAFVACELRRQHRTEPGTTVCRIRYLERATPRTRPSSLGWTKCAGSASQSAFFGATARSRKIGCCAT